MTCQPMIGGLFQRIRSRLRGAIVKVGEVTDELVHGLLSHNTDPPQNTLISPHSAHFAECPISSLTGSGQMVLLGASAWLRLAVLGPAWAARRTAFVGHPGPT